VVCGAAAADFCGGLLEPPRSLTASSQVELEDAAVFLFGERLTAPISSIESWRKRHTHPQ
jgi:hypothetical protein